MVINWGSISGENYACLSNNCIEIVGRRLGLMFFTYFNLSKLYLVGHSLGGHIFAYACDTVIIKGGIVYELTGTLKK